MSYLFLDSFCPRGYCRISKFLGEHQVFVAVSVRYTDSVKVEEGKKEQLCGLPVTDTALGIS